MASTLLQSISQDDYERARFLSKRKFDNDLESNTNTAIKVAKIGMAKNLIKMGLSNSQISEASDFTLSESEIESLRK